MKIQPKIVYSQNYDIPLSNSCELLLGLLEKLHPFDGRKYSKAWRELQEHFGNQLQKLRLEPMSAISDEELKTVHTPMYLKKLSNLFYVLQALEIPLPAFSPQLLHWKKSLFKRPIESLEAEILASILMPMRWATMGTVIAAREALNSQIAVNLSGGYHHARKTQGEGFCLFSDIAVAIAMLRKEGKLIENDKVVIIDLDAHQGNGLERIFHDDEDVYFFDAYNADIYPQDDWAKQKITKKIELSSGVKDVEYLRKIKTELPVFMDDIINRFGKPKIIFYNAGTDICKHDPLGGFKVSQEGVLERDKFVFDLLTEKGIPWVMVLSGGYTRDSYLLVAESVKYIIQTWGI